jgi:plasmid stabilization system protein ParE
MVCSYFPRMLMPRGDKSKYTAKQKRQAEHIEEGYEKRGVPKKEAERRAWATENKISGGGRKGGSGRPASKEDHSPMKKGGKAGGRASAKRSAAAKSASAKKAARTRKRRGT